MTWDTLGLIELSINHTAPTVRAHTQLAVENRTNSPRLKGGFELEKDDPRPDGLLIRECKTLPTGNQSHSTGGSKNPTNL